MNETRKIKKKKIRLSDVYRKLETMYQQVRHNWKAYIVKIIVLILLTIILIIFNLNLDSIPYINRITFYLPLLDNLIGIKINLFYVVIYILSTIPIIVICKSFFKSMKYENKDEQLAKALMPNASEEKREELSSKTIVMYPNPYNKDNEYWMLYKNSVPYNVIFEKKELIQNFLDGQYVKGTKNYGSNKALINLSKTDPSNPKPINWDDKFLISYKGGSPIFNLGITNFDEPFYWDTKKLIHEKLGGTTGAGKTIVQKSICYQALMQNCELFIYDGKQIDYTGIWKRLKNCTIVNSMKGFQNMVKMVYEIHLIRNKEFKFPFYNIDNFNRFKKPIQPRKHIFLVIEEAADIFDIDIKALSKDEKSEYLNCIEILKEIARKGRATGCHLCVNSQRLSADIIPPQINSCLKFKFCGFADNILSNIMVENTDAHDLLKDGVAGMFVDGNHNVVQTYYIDSEIEQAILKPFEITRKTMSDIHARYDIGEEELEIDGDKFVKDYVEDKEAEDPNYFKVRKDK